jgi:hypothetical protein
MPWVPMFALPSLWIEQPAETEHLALVYAEDSRVKALAAARTNFGLYLNQRERGSRGPARQPRTRRNRHRRA